MLKILVACEYSGIVRTAFERLGHNAWSCDLLPSDIPGNHLQMDNDMHLKDTLYNEHWDMVIGHPPCTRLCNSGVLRLYKNSKKEFGIDSTKWQDMEQGAIFFKMILNCPAKYVVVENPIPHGYALERIGDKYSQIIQPYNFGEDATKATCLWIKGLPLLKPTKHISPSHGANNNLYANQSPSGNNNLGSGKGKERAKTYPGIADAMANQWTDFLKTQI